MNKPLTAILSLLSAGTLALAPGAAAAHVHHRAAHSKHHGTRVRRPMMHIGSAAAVDPGATVISFSKHVLTLSLASGARVSGRVTGVTAISCSAPTDQSTTDGSTLADGSAPATDGSTPADGSTTGDGSSAGDGSASLDAGSPPDASAAQADSTSPAADPGSGDTSAVDSSCDDTALVSGAAIGQADLAFPRSGAAFRRLTVMP